MESNCLSKIGFCWLQSSFFWNYRYIDDSDSKLEIFQDGVSSLGSACYIEGALSSLLLLSIGFHDDFTRGVLTNANCGGKRTKYHMTIWLRYFRYLYTKKKEDIWLHVLVCCILGENVHRGAALGALLAANTVNVGSSAPQRWKDGLHSAKPEVEVIVQQKL